jgi:hypothetical protein
MSASSDSCMTRTSPWLRVPSVRSALVFSSTSVTTCTT